MFCLYWNAIYSNENIIMKEWGFFIKNNSTRKFSPKQKHWINHWIIYIKRHYSFKYNKPLLGVNESVSLTGVIWMGWERVMGVAAEAEMLAPVVLLCWPAECCTAAARSWAWACCINNCCCAGVKVNWTQRDRQEFILSIMTTFFTRPTQNSTDFHGIPTV